MRKRKIGFVFQKFNLLPTLSARSNIQIAQEIAGNGHHDSAFFERITELLGLRERLNHARLSFRVASSSVSPWPAL